MTRRRVAAAGVVAVVLALLAVGAVAGVRWWRDSQRTDLQRAMALAPDDGQRFSWTDWAGVRRALGVDLSEEPTSAEVDELLDQGYDADLTATSALVGSAAAMQARLGFSPASVDWELFTQSEAAAVVTLGLPESADFGEITEKLRVLGYDEPESADGIWEGSPDVLADAGALTPELTFIGLDADEQLIVASDSVEGAEAGTEAARADKAPGGGLGEVVDDVADAADPLAAAIYTGDEVCGSLSMGQADSTDQDQAAELVEAAGEVNPMTGFAMAVEPGGDVRVAMGFENEEQARTNADARAALAAGPAPGQGGDFSDRFTLGDVTAEGLVVTMELDPVEGSYVLSDLSTGPVLFATC